MLNRLVGRKSCLATVSYVKCVWNALSLNLYQLLALFSIDMCHLVVERMFEINCVVPEIMTMNTSEI